jgi:hypothetical protein
VGGGGGGGGRGAGGRELVPPVAPPSVGRLGRPPAAPPPRPTLIDFSFKEALAARLPRERLPVFLASFHFATSLLSLLAQLFGLGFMVRVLGVRRAPLVLPVLLLAAVLGAMLTGGLATVIVLRGLDGALRNSLHRPSSELLQVPLSDRLRRRAKPLIDVLGMRAGQAAAALGLLLMIGARATPAVRLAVVAGLLIVWAMLAGALGRRYVDLLRAALARPQADPSRPLGVSANAPSGRAEIDATQPVGPLLDGLLVEQDGSVRDRILRTLEVVQRAHPEAPLDEDILGRAALAAVRSAHRYLSWRLFLDEGALRAPARRTATRQLLRDLLAEREENAVERLFRVLALRYPREDFHHLLRELRSGGCRTRATGRELIENLLAGPARALTLALVDDASDRQRLSAMTDGRPPRQPTYRRLLATIRDDEEGGGMLGALATRHAAELTAPPAALASARGKAAAARA